MQNYLPDQDQNIGIPVYDILNCGPNNRFVANEKLVSNCNPQNFKQKAKVGGTLRECILAPPGHALVVVDAAQIEARIVAWLAEEEWVLEAFREKRDLYCEFGQDVYNRIITKADIEERFVSKTAFLGLGFQMGGPKLQTSLLTKSIEQGLEPVRLPVEICYDIVNKYRTKCSKIRDLWKYVNDSFIATMMTGRRLEYKGLSIEEGKINLPNGLALLYPGLDAHITKTMFGEIVQNASYLSARSRSKVYGGLLTENIVQALARIIVAEVMRIIAQKYRVVMMSHDEIVFITKKKEAKKALEWAIALMSVPPSWALDLPLSAEGSYDVCYSK